MDKEKIRNNKFIKWFFEKQIINDSDPLIEQFWKIQWNNKALIMIECGIVIILLNHFFPK